MIKLRELLKKEIKKNNPNIGVMADVALDPYTDHGHDGILKNKDLKPSEVSYGSGKKVWWVCPKKHEYKASIMHRSHGTECPECNAGRQTSFAEQATYYYVKMLYPDAVSRYTASFLNRMELDIYIPSIKLAIEYDGEAWHGKNTLKREERKYKICKKNKIKLIRLREKMPEFPNDIACLLYTSPSPRDS